MRKGCNFAARKGKQRKTTMNRIYYVTLLVLILSACCQTEQKREEEAICVTTEILQLGNAPAQIPYVGVIEEEQSTMVSFTGMGVLKSMKVSEGQKVQKGQLLATIDDTQARNALAAAQSALDQAIDAQTRMKQLYDKNSLPEMKWVEIESKVQQARSSYEMCKKNLEDCSIYAPCSGVVGRKIMNVGETVLPSESVLTILSINKVKVRVSVPEMEISRIQPQMQSNITLDAIPGEMFQGGIIEKGVVADAVTHTYDIRILLDNADHRLLPGMVAKVFLMQADSNTAVTLPVKAIQQSSNGSLFVWVVKDGKASRQEVKVGQAVGNRIIMEGGVEQGTQVIVEGYQKVGQGTPVFSR